MYQIVEGIGGTADDFGSITAFTSMIEIPALVCFSRLQKRFSVRSLLLFSAVFLIVRVLVICYAPNIAWLYVAGALQILSYGLFAPATVYYVNDIVGEANRNKGQTLLSTAFCISAVLGSLIGGNMLSAAGGDPHDMLIVGALVSAVGAAILFLTRPRLSGSR
jgi:PPP family 3-phenylpropionic acid transporter